MSIDYNILTQDYDLTRTANINVINQGCCIKAAELYAVYKHHALGDATFNQQALLLFQSSVRKCQNA